MYMYVTLKYINNNNKNNNNSDNIIQTWPS